jgi:superfamily I DNA/RNA helicase
MTLHSAKGLEFPVVFLAGLEEDLLPHRKAVEEGDRAVEEERRLFYVGITRAQRRLVITSAAARTTWGKERPCLPSRFLGEVADRDLFRRETHDPGAAATPEDIQGCVEAYRRLKSLQGDR